VASAKQAKASPEAPGALAASATPTDWTSHAHVRLWPRRLWPRPSKPRPRPRHRARLRPRPRPLTRPATPMRVWGDSAGALRAPVASAKQARASPEAPCVRACVRRAPCAKCAKCAQVRPSAQAPLRPCALAPCALRPRPRPAPPRPPARTHARTRARARARGGLCFVVAQPPPQSWPNGLARGGRRGTRRPPRPNRPVRSRVPTGAPPIYRLISFLWPGTRRRQFSEEVSPQFT